MKELFKSIAGYEGLYEISNYGVVRSLDRLILYANGSKHLHKGVIIKPEKDIGGYHRVNLYKDGKPNHFFVHRLVYETFKSKIPDGIEINHIDENKTNNRLDNLNLMNRKENINYGTRTKRASEKMTNGKRSEPILQYTLDGKLVREFPSINECRRAGFNQGHVIECLNGKRKTHKGFIFSRKNKIKL